MAKPVCVVVLHGNIHDVEFASAISGFVCCSGYEHNLCIFRRVRDTGLVTLLAHAHDSR